MLSNAYFLAKFRFDTAENEPAKHLQNFRKMHFRKMQCPADEDEAPAAGGADRAAPAPGGGAAEPPKQLPGLADVAFSITARNRLTSWFAVLTQAAASDASRLSSASGITSLLALNRCSFPHRYHRVLELLSNRFPHGLAVFLVLSNRFSNPF